MATVGMRGIMQAIRTRLLTFTSASGGPTLAVLLGSTSSGSGRDGKIFTDQAPDNIGGFYGVMRLIDAAQQGMDGGLMLRCQVELILYGRPRENQAAVERMADLVQEAWLYWSVTEFDGTIIVARTMHRMGIPYEDPVDRELVAIRLLLPFRTTPQFLVQYAST